MVWIPGGSFLMGSDHHYPEEAPVHPVHVDGFWMDQHAVTNQAFGRFVAATGYVTAAEVPPRAEDYPGADPSLLVAGSAVFQQPSGPVDRRDCLQWWGYIPGACWRHPDGPASDLTGREQHPVVHVTYADVAAYALWAGKEVPTEAEWERAARGGLEGADFCWGDELAPEGRHLANTWQGDFPWENRVEDGFAGLAPVGSFAANGYGLCDMAGNVWEWTSDWFSPRHAGPPTGKSCCVPRNPRGPRREGSHDPHTADRTPRKVLKGGSFLCAPCYCFRYRPAARYPQTIDTSTSHIGFRLVRRVP